MAWRADLKLDYTCESNRSVARYLHSGPLRILQSLYPEGDGICHNVLVHPPGGLVGGDTLDIQVSVAPGAHGLVNKLLEGVTGAVLAKICVLVFIIIFIQKRPQGIFAMKGRSAEA